MLPPAAEALIKEIVAYFNGLPLIDRGKEEVKQKVPGKTPGEPKS
jgi:hypothetical protein